MTPAIQDMFVSIYDTSPKHINMSYSLNLLIYYMTIKKTKEVNKTLDNLFTKHLINNYFVNNLLISKSKDKLSYTIDFKTALLISYKQDEVFTEYSSLDETISLHKIVINVTNNLFLYQSQYGQLILDDQGWEDEYKLVTQIYNQILRNDAENTSDLEKEVDFFFKRHLNISFNGILEDFVEKIKNTSILKEYNVKLHNQCVLSAFKYYIEKINPSYLSKY